MTTLLDANGKEVKTVGSKMRQLEIDLANLKLANLQLLSMIQQLAQQLAYNDEVNKRAFKQVNVDVEQIVTEINAEINSNVDPSEKPEPSATETTE